MCIVFLFKTRPFKDKFLVGRYLLWSDESLMIIYWLEMFLDILTQH